MQSWSIKGTITLNIRTNSIEYYLSQTNISLLNRNKTDKQPQTFSFYKGI